MQNHLSFSRTAISLSLASLLLVSGNASAGWVSDTGADGLNGANGVDGNVGTNGGDGLAGGDASAFVNADDAANYAIATGGNGGFGGDGGDSSLSGADGGNGGNGGAGGNAAAGAALLTPGFIVNGAASTSVSASGGAGNNGGRLGRAGGGGGAPGTTGDSGNGGSAYAEAGTRATGNIDVTALAVGGAGGGAFYDAFSGTSRAGNGGAASLGRVYGESTAGGDVSVFGRAVGGAGGASTGWNAYAGDGAGVSLLNAVDGDTSGRLTLTQSATGGASGDANYGPAGRAGAASSLLDKTTSSSALIIRTGASGGAGGYKNLYSGLPGTGVSGGLAEASARGVNTAGTVDIIATASGGNGGNGYNGNRAARGGQATASAEGVSASSLGVRAIARGGRGGRTTSTGKVERGGRASAAASATGLWGYASTTASSGAVADRNYVQATANAQLGDTSASVATTSNAKASASMGEGMSDRALLTDTQASAFADLLPTTAEAAAALQGNSRVQAALSAENSLALGLLGGAYSLGSVEGVSNTYSSVIEFSVDMNEQASGALKLGLLDPLFSGAHGFDNLSFRVDVEGVQVTNVSFTDLGAARSYFDDTVLNYGFWPDQISADNVLDMRFYFDLTEQHLGEGFNTNFVVGVSAVPAPAAVWLFGSGLLGLLGVARRRRR